MAASLVHHEKHTVEDDILGGFSDDFFDEYILQDWAWKAGTQSKLTASGCGRT
jgi:hypothetical protein